MAQQCARVVQRVDTAKEGGSGHLGESTVYTRVTCLTTRVCIQSVAQLVVYTMYREQCA